MGFFDLILAADTEAEKSAQEKAIAQAGRIERLVAGCSPFQRRFIEDQSSYKSLRCPRRAGKSFAMTAQALFIGETIPNSRILIISLTLKSTKENYWTGAPAGLMTLNHKFDLGLRFHHTDVVWWHQNGSRGRLAGAETRADIEYLRGAAAEADVVLLDECKSFAPGLLRELMDDILEPGLMTRDGRIVMGGTPGLVPVGPFYEATCETNRVEIKDERGAVVESYPTCVRFDPLKSTRRDAKVFVNEDGEEEAEDEPWSLHHWTIKDNPVGKKPGDEYGPQWRRALRIKRRKGWADDHPTWRREYLGEWVMDGDGLVYAYSAAKAKAAAGKGPGVTWYPQQTKENVTGLPKDDGPWHLVYGLDLGFEDETALVVAAYSERLNELRHVYDFKAPHMYPPEVLTLLQETMARFGRPVAVVGDAGNLGKMLVEWFASVGVPMEKAEKVEKNDHVELLNGDFLTGNIKIIPKSDLENELCALQWDLSEGSKAELARTGKLKEDKKLPNHLCDALLYLWRFSYHYFARREAEGPTRGTPEWYAQKEREAEEKASREHGRRTFVTDGLVRDTTGLLTRESVQWQSALSRLRPN